MQLNRFAALSQWWTRTALLTLSIWLFGVLATACTVAVPELKVRPASSYANTADKDGLRIAVHPITDNGEMEDAFQVNLLEKGLLPVLLVVETHSTTTSFIVARENLMVHTRH